MDNIYPQSSIFVLGEYCKVNLKTELKARRTKVLFKNMKVGMICYKAASTKMQHWKIEAIKQAMLPFREERQHIFFVTRVET